MLFGKITAVPPPSGPERRRSVRHATVLQVAKIRLGAARQELCLLRDVSPEGLRAEIYCAAARGERAAIELRTGHRIEGGVVWAEAPMIGVAFDAPMPMSGLLAHCSFSDRTGGLRPPRLEVDLAATLRLGREEVMVRIGNVSQAGMKLAAPEQIVPGTICAIVLDGMEPRAATIRWWRGGEGGLMLAEPLSYAEFASWRSGSAALAAA